MTHQIFSVYVCGVHHVELVILLSHMRLSK
jgi:hypothetical protein